MLTFFMTAGLKTDETDFGAITSDRDMLIMNMPSWFVIVPVTMLESRRLTRLMAAYSIGFSLFFVKTEPEIFPIAGRLAPAGGCARSQFISVNDIIKYTAI
jgi:hypothetical protein